MSLYINEAMRNNDVLSIRCRKFPRLFHGDILHDFRVVDFKLHTFIPASQNFCHVLNHADILRKLSEEISYSVHRSF